MLSFALITLFAATGIAALVSLADSALKLRHAWIATRRELASLQSGPVPLDGCAVVMLRPVSGVHCSARRSIPLAVAA